jgi:hypothetical protein
MLSKDLINIIVNYVGFHKDLDFEIPLYEKHLNKVNWNELSEIVIYQFHFLKIFS